MADEFKSDARDGDGDGFVQDATPYERPIEELEINPLAEEESTPEPEATDDVIASEEPTEGESQPAVAPVADNVIGSATAKKTTKKKSTKKSAPKVETVALYSTRNVSWIGVGRVNVGLNLVTKDQADKWLTRDHIRAADPKEVAEEL